MRRTGAVHQVLETARVTSTSFPIDHTGDPHMSSADDGRQATMDPTQIYREETFTDRRVGTIRRLTPVGADGAPDAARPVLYVGQAQVMTPMGAVPISFELEAPTLSAAIAKFGEAAETGGTADRARAAGNSPRASIVVGHSRQLRRRLAQSQRSAGPRRGRAARRYSQRLQRVPARIRRFELLGSHRKRSHCGAGRGRILAKQLRIAERRLQLRSAPPRAVGSSRATPRVRAALCRRRLRVLAAAGGRRARRRSLRGGRSRDRWRRRATLTQPIAVSADVLVDAAVRPRTPACW